MKQKQQTLVVQFTAHVDRNHRVSEPRCVQPDRDVRGGDRQGRHTVVTRWLQPRLPDCRLPRRLLPQAVAVHLCSQLLPT